MLHGLRMLRQQDHRVVIHKLSEDLIALAKWGARHRTPTTGCSSSIVIHAVCGLSEIADSGAWT